jgi:hypothetical protein
MWGDGFFFDQVGGKEGKEHPKMDSEKPAVR